MDRPQDLQAPAPKPASCGDSPTDTDTILAPKPRRPKQGTDPLALIPPSTPEPSTPEPKPWRHSNSVEKSPYRPQSSASYSTCEPLRPLSALSCCSATAEDEAGSRTERHLRSANSEEQQERRVFVGGVPQDMDSDRLMEFFSNYEGCQKAWVQKHKESRDPRQPPPRSLHRGFGWAVFWSVEHVDKLIGKGQRQSYLFMENGRRIEVKRAEAYVRGALVDKNGAESSQLRGHGKSRSGTPSMTTPSPGLSAPASPCKHGVEALPPRSPWGRGSWAGPEMGKGQMRQPMMPMPQPMPTHPQGMPPMPEMYGGPGPYAGRHSPFGGGSPGPSAGYWPGSPTGPTAVPTYHDHQVTGSQPWMSRSPMGEATQHRVWSTPIPEDAATTGLPHDPRQALDRGATTPEALAGRMVHSPQPMMPMPYSMPQPMPTHPSQRMPAMPEMYGCPGPYAGHHSPFGGGGPCAGSWPMPQAAAAARAYHDPQAPGAQPWMSQSPMGEVPQHRVWSAPIPEDVTTGGPPHASSPGPDMGSIMTPEALAARIRENPQMAKTMLTQAIPEVYEE